MMREGWEVGAAKLEAQLSQTKVRVVEGEGWGEGAV